MMPVFFVPSSILELKLMIAEQIKLTDLATGV